MAVIHKRQINFIYFKLEAVGVFWRNTFHGVNVCRWTFNSNIKVQLHTILLCIYYTLCFSEGLHSDDPCWAGFCWLVLCWDWTLLEAAQGAVLVAVPGRVPLQPAPGVSFIRAPWLRAEGQTLEWAPWRWQRSHGAHGVRDAQEGIITAWVGYVAVWSARHEVGLTLFLLLDDGTLGQRVNLERFLCLQHVCRVLLRNHPAL